MKKPIIGITLDSENPGNYSKFPWYAIRNNYLHSIEKYGGIPFPLLHTQVNVRNIFNLLDGLIITGGNFDISPNIYGIKTKDTRIIKSDRTNFEISICKMFLKSSKPILGICGGEQLLNVACGGTLIQDIKKHNKKHNKKSLEHEQKNPRNQTSHEVNIIKDTLISNIIKEKIIMVNSAHHQAIDKLGKNLMTSGIANDQIVESIEHIFHNWCIGVQWHPEFLITNSDIKIIKSFIKASINE
jgi:putative glutamine amidotransferase